MIKAILIWTKTLTKHILYSHICPSIFHGYDWNRCIPFSTMIWQLVGLWQYACVVALAFWFEAYFSLFRSQNPSYWFYYGILLFIIYFPFSCLLQNLIAILALVKEISAFISISPSCRCFFIYSTDDWANHAHMHIDTFACFSFLSFSLFYWNMKHEISVKLPKSVRSTWASYHDATSPNGFFLLNNRQVGARIVAQNIRHESRKPFYLSLFPFSFA